MNEYAVLGAGGFFGISHDFHILYMPHMSFGQPADYGGALKFIGTYFFAGL